MNKQVPSEKEISIYTAVFELAKLGLDLKTVRVQQIADAAGMGKGTLYEYFSSKDEIIEKTLTYFMHKEIENFLVLLNGDENFEEILRKGLRGMLKGKACYSSFQVLFSSSNRLGPQQFLEQNRVALAAMMPVVIDILDQLIEIGIEEGKIQRALDRAYQRFVIVGAVSVFNMSGRLALLSEDEGQLKEVEDYAIQMIFSALSPK